MHENSGNSVIYYAHYTEDGVNKTGLTVTITVYEVIRDGTKTEVVTDGACTEIGDGLYRYLLASGTVDAAAEYVAVFHTATDTVDAQDIPAIWVIDRAGTEKLDTGVTLADDAITAAKFDESTAYPLKSADTGTTKVARVGADSDTLETLSDEIAAVKAETALILADTGTDGVVLKAAGLAADAVTEIQSGLALEATLTAIKGAGWSTETLAAIDVLIDAIKAKTDLIPATPAVADEYDAALAAIQADLDNPAQYKADVSGLATQISVNAIPTTPLLAANYVVPDNVTIGEIKAKTDNIPTTPLTAQQVWEYVTRELTSQGSGGATAQEVWEYATRVLTAGTNIDLTSLAKTTHLQEVEDKVDGIKDITDQMVFTVPNKVDASATVDPTGIATSEEMGIIGEKVDGVLNKLNISSVEFVTAVVGTTITILRGDTLSARLLDLGDFTGYTSIDFTIKRVAGELDDAAKIRLRKNASGADDGLLRLNGAEYATATDGSIVIDDTTTGDIEIRLNANATSELVPGNYVYDIQIITSNNVRTLTAGKLKVDADVTRATV